MSQQELSPLTERKIKEIADFLFRRDYPSTLLIDIFDTFGANKTTCEALAVLQSGKIIRLDKRFGEKATQISVRILDNKGKDIRHEICDTYPNSETFGNWFYETLGASQSCFEDHGNNEMREYECITCFHEKASWLCVSHNQSMMFCQKCRETTKKYNQFLIDNKMDRDEFIKVLMDEHKKYLIKRKGLPVKTPLYRTMVKEKIKK